MYMPIDLLAAQRRTILPVRGGGYAAGESMKSGGQWKKKKEDKRGDSAFSWYAAIPEGEMAAAAGVWSEVAVALRFRAAEVGACGHDDANDDAKEAERASKNLDDQNLHEERRVLCVRQRAPGTCYTDAHTAGQICQADCDTCPENTAANTFSLHHY
jgi:hypothetical protein